MQCRVFRNPSNEIIGTGWSKTNDRRFRTMLPNDISCLNFTTRIPSVFFFVIDCLRLRSMDGNGNNPSENIMISRGIIIIQFFRRQHPTRAIPFSAVPGPMKRKFDFRKSGNSGKMTITAAIDTSISSSDNLLERQKIQVKPDSKYVKITEIPSLGGASKTSISPMQKIG